MDEPRTTLMVARPYELPPVHADPLFWKEMHLGMNSYVYSPLFYTGLGLSIAMLVFSFLAMNLSMNHRQPWIESSHELAGPRDLHPLSARVLRRRRLHGLEHHRPRAAARDAGLIAHLAHRPRRNPEPKMAGHVFPWLGLVDHLRDRRAGERRRDGDQHPGRHAARRRRIHPRSVLREPGFILSVVSKTVLAAHGKIAMVLLFILFGTWIFAEVIATGGNDSMTLFFQVGLNPSRGGRYRSPGGTTIAVPRWTTNSPLRLVGVALYGFLSILLYLLAAWRFKRERNWRVEDGERRGVSPTWLAILRECTSASRLDARRSVMSSAW